MSEEKPKVNSAVQVMRVVLVVAAVVALVAGCAVAGAVVSNHGESADSLVLAGVAVVSGLILAVLLIVASSIVGMLATLVGRVNAQPVDDVRPTLDRLEQSLRLLNNLQTRSGAAEVRDAGGGGRSPVLAMEQLRDITLMSEEQRKNYATRHWGLRKRMHVEAIDREVLVGDWASVFGRLEELQVVLPGDGQIVELRERVESEQNSRLEEDVRIARNRIRQLTAGGTAANWTQAEDLAGSLQVKYPGKAVADQLAEDVRREREAWERENAERLFRDIAAATEKRQWKHGVLAVEEFIRRYPLDPRSEALRLDLPMLQDNAGTQERKEQEENFKDLLKKQRYEEALGVAKAVVAKYPHSPTATELQKLMPRVEEMAKAEAAKVPAAVGAT